MAPRANKKGTTCDEHRHPWTISLVSIHCHKIPLRVLPIAVHPGIVLVMNASESPNTPSTYEPPTITRVGSLSELTRFGQRPNFSDARPGPDDAESNESGA